MTLIFRITLLVIALLLGAVVTTHGQTTADTQPDAPLTQEAPDLLGRLHLTPEQRQQIRQIQRDMKDERALVNQRLRESNRALQDALDAGSVDENLIEQRIQAVNAAQNAQLRMRIETEIRIRRVLNPEQLAILREIRLRAADLIRAQQDRRQRRPGNDGLQPAQRNGIAPLRRSDALPPPRP
jgi:Spy/CpxP family protein refolding chaperone